MTAQTMWGGMMEYLYASEYAAFVSVDEDTAGDHLLDEVMNFEDEPVIQSIKLQKKGTMETVTLAISEVETWDNLLRALGEHFSYSNVEPQITSFDGNLISSAENYKAHLKPGLHLIVYFPPTINEISQSLGALFMASTSECPHFVRTPDSPQGSQLANYLNPPPTLARPPPSKPRRYRLQAPTIYFTVPAPTAINITLSSSAFKNIANDDEEWEHSTGPAALAARYSHSTTLPPLAGNYRDMTPESEEILPDYATVREKLGLLVEPLETDRLPPWILPPWRQNPIHSYVKGGELNPSAYRLVFGGKFPITSFDLFAQTHRRRAMCSIGWDVIAFPEGGLEDIVSGKAMPNISWAVGDGEADLREYSKTSEKRMYGNSEGPIRSGNNIENNSDWWMLEPEKLPTEFSGKADEHTFLLDGVAEVAAHLNAFMNRCGIAQNITKGFVNYWVQNLGLSGPAARVEPHDDFPNTIPDYNLASASIGTPKLVLLKFLHPQELQNLLPMSFTPEPHRIVRLFAVFRVIEQQEIDAGGIGAHGDFEMEVSRVVGDIGSCGGGFNCGHRGINVAEVGGVRVFGDQDE